MNVEIANISKSFGKNKVLDNVSLFASAGETLCLLGPSGAGKTTLVRLIIGALSADQGTITIDGIRIPNLGMSRNIGYMPQNDAVYNDISGYDNILFFGRLYGLKGDDLKKGALDILNLVGLINDKDKLVAYYSGGMKKRLSLGIALLHSPSVLILDEPTVGIDPLLRKSIWDEFERRRLCGNTLIITTHVMDEALKCQKAALIYNGSLIENGTIESLKAKTTNGNLEELFFTDCGGTQA